MAQLSRSVVFLTVVLLLVSVVSAQNPISYIYDDLGRLIAAVDPASDTAIYNYDSVGNVTSISRQASSQTSILAFAPKTGLVGTVVTIYGTGFSSTPSQNTVQFNGTTATVTSSTATQIVASVPAGTTTGLISVTAPGGSDSSSDPFTVNSKAPTIASFTPTIGVIGTAVSVTGTNFETTLNNNNVSFNVSRSALTSATTTAIGATVPRAGSGKISVTTPYGKAASSSDFFVPPTGFIASDIEYTDRITAGVAKTATISTAAKVGLLVFDSTIRRRISLRITGVTAAGYVSIRNPDGTLLVGALSVTTAGLFIDAKVLPYTGTYTILMDPTGSNTGSWTLTLYDFLDVTGAITPGGAAVATTTTTPGQNSRLSFDGAANQKVSLNLSSVTIAESFVSILKPDGTSLANPANIGTGGGFIDTLTLPVAGSYTILVDPTSINTGGMTLTLYDVVDVTGAITPGGAAVPVSLTVPGQNARLTFSGTSGQRVSLNLTNVTVSSRTSSILNPDGSTLGSTTGLYLDTLTLPTTGTYTVLANPSSTNLGNITLTLYDVPADVTGTIVPGGSAVTVTLGTAGQNARLTFSGTLNQKISLRMTGVTIGTSYVSILKPDSSYLVNPTYVDTGGAFIDTKILPATGTYTIVVDPQTTSTGNMTLTLYDVVDASGTLTIGDPPVTVTITTPGQTGNYTFSGTSGQQVTVRITSNTMSQLTVRLLKPDSTQLTSSFSSSSSFNLSTQTLPTTGTYTVVVDPAATNTGSCAVQVTSP
jgi:YD repeat-containing protein